MTPTPQTLVLTQPDDWHLHLRDGAAMQDVVADSARQFARAIIMPNLKPPVTTAEQAQAYRARIVAACQRAAQTEPVCASFEPLMTLYLTDRTRADDIRAAKESGCVHGVKWYPAGATTHSEAGVTDWVRVRPALAAMEALDLPLLLHGEVVDPTIDVFDRERVFIDRVLVPLQRDFPGLRVVLEHITTREAVQYVAEAPGRTAATITAHHLLYDRNALFAGGLQPHWYCLPVLKRAVHRQALLTAATSGSARFFLGTDSAPHARSLKEQSCGCAGCYTALHAMALYAWSFEQAGALHQLEGFASLHGPAFYGLPRNTRQLVLQRMPYNVPDEIPFAGATLKPLAAGQVLPWQLVGVREAWGS